MLTFYVESSCALLIGNCLVSNLVSAPQDIESHPRVDCPFHYRQLLLKISSLDPPARVDCPFHRAYLASDRVSNLVSSCGRDNIQYRSRQIVHSSARALPPDKRSAILLSAWDIRALQLNTLHRNILHRNTLHRNTLQINTLHINTLPKYIREIHCHPIRDRACYH